MIHVVNFLAVSFSGCDDVTVLSSDDEESKEGLIKGGSKVTHKIRRILLQNEEMKIDSLSTSKSTCFNNRDGCSSGEDSDNESLVGNCNDDLTIIQFESPTKKFLHPLKSLELLHRVIVVTMMK